MSWQLVRRLLGTFAIGLFAAAMLYPFRPSLAHGLLGPLGQALFVYVLIGWVFILVGVDPTGAGAFFSFISPWPGLNVLLALFILFRPSFQYWKWLRIAVIALGVFSPIVAWRLADAVSAIPLVLWSAASIMAATAVNLQVRARLSYADMAQ